MRLSAITMVIAASALSASGPGSAQVPAPKGEERVVVRTGPHWMPGLPLTSSRSFACDRYDIAYELAYRPTASGPRAEMRRLTVDGRPVEQAWLSAVNSLLAGFSSPPEVVPECGRRQIRISLAQIDRGGSVVRTERVSLEPAP